MYGSIGSATGAINLQATLSASSACTSTVVEPHHPITCSGPLFLHEDGRFECEHAAVPNDDERTIYCIQHSVAILLIECAIARFSG